MQPANDPSTDYRQLVRRGYDACAADYDAARRNEPEPLLSLLTDRLPAGASVLDLGCGAGVPVARDLAAAGCRVTGVDLSPAMIALAQRRVPAARFLCGDILEVAFEPGSFDAVVSFYAIFHLPRERHDELFRRVHRWLAPGGLLLATLSWQDEPAYTEDDFFSQTMYWSYYGLARYRDLLREIGFALLQVSDTGHGYDPEEGAPPESHPAILAAKPA